MNTHSIKILSILCEDTSESNILGGDELYIVCQADAGIPIHIPFGNNEGHSMKEGDVWHLIDGEGLTLNFEYELLISLWDLDSNLLPSNSTFLQCYSFRPETESGTHYAKFKNHNGAYYKLYFTK